MKLPLLSTRIEDHYNSGDLNVLTVKSLGHLRKLLCFKSGCFQPSQLFLLYFNREHAPKEIISHFLFYFFLSIFESTSSHLVTVSPLAKTHATCMPLKQDSSIYILVLEAWSPLLHAKNVFLLTNIACSPALKNRAVRVLHILKSGYGEAFLHILRMASVCNEININVMTIVPTWT